MTDQFFERPILNSPYAYPAGHWELDAHGQPTNRIVEQRRRAEFITPIPKPKKRRGSPAQEEIIFDEATEVSSADQRYETMSIVNDIRRCVDAWRKVQNPSDWRVTPETARLLQHWRHHAFSSFRPFFCQVEAAETMIWLAEVAPNLGKEGRAFLDYFEAASEQANPGLARIALKLATGAGKTTVMAMLIAWQTINALRRPNSKKFTRGFLVVTPGITIRDRLRVLQPNDPDSYYQSRELVPSDMLGDLGKAKIVITNFHAFKLRETIDLSKGGRALLEGRVQREADEIKTLETEGQMLQRVMPDLMGMKSVLVLNDEAHHCYRAKPGDDDEGELKGDDKKEAEKNREAARLWIADAMNDLNVRELEQLMPEDYYIESLKRAYPGEAFDFDTTEQAIPNVVNRVEAWLKRNAKPKLEKWRPIQQVVADINAGSPKVPDKLYAAASTVLAKLNAVFEAGAM